MSNNDSLVCDVKGDCIWWLYDGCEDCIRNSSNCNIHAEDNYESIKELSKELDF